jgi:hypothetical protein
MKKIFLILFGTMLFVSSCSTDLDQSPTNIASAGSLTDLAGVLNAAYFYQSSSVSPMAIMGDFRADNAFMFEAPFTEMDLFTANLTTLEADFFGQFYTALYKSILSANNVIENSTDATEVGEAKFLRGLSYFKLVQVFGDVTVNLSATPSTSDTSILVRQPKADVYNNVIIPDLSDAIASLSTTAVDGRATKIAAQALLGKVYMHLGNFTDAANNLSSVVSGAGGAGISLQNSYADIFGAANDLNSEIIFATQINSSIGFDETTNFGEFWEWFNGGSSKVLDPLDADLIAAFDASPGDLRRAVTLNAAETASAKFGSADDDWIELRLGDMILLYAEALNENGNTASAVTELNKIRTRAGLANTTASSQGDVRTAIANERRLELAFEGQRWFDLVRTNTVDAEMGMSINSNYHVFPIPISEINATNGVITQNAGY